jgi:hypothetical protein
VKYVAGPPIAIRDVLSPTIVMYAPEVCSSSV